MRSIFKCCSLWLLVFNWLTFSVIHFPAVTITALPHYSFSGVMKNYSYVWQRERTEWFVIAWDPELARLTRYPFADDDPQKNAPVNYCFAPQEVQADFVVDKLPLGPALDKFGPRDKYNLTEYRMLAAQTRLDGLVRGETKLAFVGQNPASIDVFGSTLVTWRFQTHTKSKVMYSFADRLQGYAAPTQTDWLELRNMSSGEHWPLFGEDMRLFLSASGKLLANWCEVSGEINGRRAVQFFFGEILPPLSAKTPLYSSFHESLFVKYPPTHVSTRHERSPTSEKNWPMFEYEGNIVFLERIQPMRAVVPGTSAPPRTHQGIPGTVFAHTVSLTASKNFCWLWGDLRGGTPALLVGGEYLAFFHSVAFMNSHIVRTYFVGAYTFTAKPPFSMTSMSRWPIVPDTWTKGWTYADVDFVPFPTTFAFDDVYVNVTLGWEEGEGRVLHLDRKALFASLRKMQPVVLGASSDDWSDGAPYDSFEYLPDGGKHCSRFGGSANCASIRRSRRSRRLRAAAAESIGRRKEE